MFLNVYGKKYQKSILEVYRQLIICHRTKYLYKAQASLKASLRLNILAVPDLSKCPLIGVRKQAATVVLFLTAVVNVHRAC